MTSRLSEADSRHFVEETLGVSDTRRKFNEDKLALLNEIIDRFINTVPFQNIEFLATEITARRIPTLAENVTSVFELRGGLCWTLNSALGLVLTQLGYSVFYVIGTVTLRTLDLKDNHIMVIATDVLVARDKYLVDVGFGFPFFHAIPLDFEEESPAFRQSIETMKYVKRGDDIIRMHKHSGDGSRYPRVEGQWYHSYHFRLVPVSLDSISASIDKSIYSNHHVLVGILNVIAFISWRHDRCVRVRGATLQQETNAGELVSRDLPTAHDVIETLSRLLPTVSPATVRAAVRRNWPTRSCLFKY